MIDYGTIVVFFHRNLCDEQKIVIVNQSVENQLLTHNRSHYNNILANGLHVAHIVDEKPFDIHFIAGSEYEYRFSFKIFGDF